MTSRKSIQELQKGDRFYFTGKRSELFTVIGIVTNKCGNKKCIKTVIEGRLKPVYLGINHLVEVIKK